MVCTYDRYYKVSNNIFISIEGCRPGCRQIIAGILPYWLMIGNNLAFIHVVCQVVCPSTQD